MENNKNGLGVAGFVVALIGFLLTLIPLIRIIGVIICAVGFILSLIGVFKKPRTLSIIGIVLALAGCIIYWIKYAQFAKAVSEAVGAYLN